MWAQIDDYTVIYIILKKKYIKEICFGIHFTCPTNSTFSTKNTNIHGTPANAHIITPNDLQSHAQRHLPHVTRFRLVDLVGWDYSKHLATLMRNQCVRVCLFVCDCDSVLVIGREDGNSVWSRRSEVNRSLLMDLAEISRGVCSD